MYILKTLKKQPHLYTETSGGEQAKGIQKEIQTVM